MRDNGKNETTIKGRTEAGGRRAFTYEVGVCQGIPADVVERRVEVNEHENRNGGLRTARNGKASRCHRPYSIHLREISGLGPTKLLSVRKGMRYMSS